MPLANTCGLLSVGLKRRTVAAVQRVKTGGLVVQGRVDQGSVEPGGHCGPWWGGAIPVPFELALTLARDSWLEQHQSIH